MLDIFSQHRYQAPKWQAYVTPGDKAFTFANGVAVSSLYELKQALVSVPEDVINHHLSEDKHDLADWVEFVVGDEELAAELRKQTHRWGLIVALERQMTRTLQLPHYLAKRWLSKTEHPFTFSSGEKASSLTELAKVLEKVSDETIAFHCERMPNDVAVWVADIIGDYELSELLDQSTTRDQMHRFVTDHIEMLKEASE